jgi:tetratricopeptide (TPR) repeat protein
MIRRPAVHAALVAASIAATLLPAGARAQSGDKSDNGAPAVSDQAKADARRHFLRGKELHAAGRYREAAAEYLEAYDRFPAPAFLYNVAQVYRLAGDRDTALENYRKYLELEPDGEGSADAREFIAALEAAAAAENEARAADKPPPPAPEPAVSGGADPIDPIQRVNTADERDANATPGRGKKIAGITLAVAGGIGIGVAVFYGLKARSANDDLDGYEGPWTVDQEETYQDGKSAQLNMILGAAVGGAALATGAVLYYLGSRDSARATERRRARALEIGAAPTGDGGFVVVRGAF